ncbi:hypothetical protein [Pedobacter jeongneungensis]
MKSRFSFKARMADFDLNLYMRPMFENHFSFLKGHGFSDFSQKPPMHNPQSNFHFVSANKHVEIDISFESITTPFYASLNNYGIIMLDLNNQTIAAYNANFNPFNFTDACDQLHDEYLGEIASILQRHINVLYGDTSQLEENTQIYKVTLDKAEIERKIKEQLFTCTFDSLWGPCIHESASLEEIRTYLLQLDEVVTNISMHDWNGNKIDFSL